MSKNFWKGYILFFIFIFPMIFEYVPMIGGDDALFYSSPRWAFTCLGIGVVAWICFIYSYYRMYIRPNRKALRNARKILKMGMQITATIERKVLIKDYGDYQRLKLDISFKNFANTLICLPWEINDGRPSGRRFEKGSALPLRIDPQLNAPVFLPEGVELYGSRKALLKDFGSFLLLVIFCIGYLIFSYWLQNKGTGWRFMHFWHPWVTIPMFGLFFGVILEGAIGMLSGAQDSFIRDLFDVAVVTGKMAKKEAKLIFNGKMAIADILKVRQTGVYINEQPQVIFDLEYTDEKKRTYLVSIKKIISLLDLGSTKKTKVPIMYLPDGPEKIIFADQYIPPGFVIASDEVSLN